MADLTLRLFGHRELLDFKAVDWSYLTDQKYPKSGLIVPD